MRRHSWNKITPPEIRKAIVFYNQALELDPKLSARPRRPGRSQLFTADYERRASQRAFPVAKAAARKAVEIDEALSLPHACLALIHFWFDWDWAAVEKEAQRAIELDPHSSFAHAAYAHLPSNLGRHEEAIGEQARAGDGAALPHH